MKKLPIRGEKKNEKSYTDDFFVCIAFFVIFIDKIKYLDYNIDR